MPVPTILAFNLSAEALKTLQTPCQAMGLRLKAVPPDGFSLPLGAMLGLPAAASPVQPSAANFDDPMLVMCGLEESAMNGFLTALRYLPLPPIPLKAVLTPTNAAWNALTLHEALAQEHAEIQKQLRKKHP